MQLGNKEAKVRIGAEAEAKRLRDQILQAAWKVTTLETREKRRNPLAPFTTAKLQQEAAQKLRMSVTRTMQNAQRLYEGVDFGEGPVGLITYMRTDSPRLAPEAVEADPRVRRQALRQGLPAAQGRASTKAGPCPGRPRGHPAHGHRPHPREPEEPPGTGPVPAVRPDLAAHLGLPDGGGAL